MGDAISYPKYDDINEKKEGCEQCENGRRYQYVRQILAETRAHALQLADYNDALASDCGAAHRKVIALEAALQTRRPRQTRQLDETERHTLLAEIAHLKQRLYGSETERGMQNAEIAQLKQLLHESENARHMAVRRAEELQQAQNIASRQVAAIRVAAQSAMTTARHKMEKLRHTNATLNVRCGAYMQEQARLIASIATVTHQLDVAREHARVMRRMAKTLSSLPPKQAVAAVRAARAEAREAQIRERSLAFAKSALELANRAERHRVEYERAFREEAARSIAAKAKEADAALNELRAEYRVVAAECDTLRRRFADAHDDAEEARFRARRLERTNSSLATQLGVATEAARGAAVELAIAERSAAQSRALAAKVARLRARCGELSAASPNNTDVDIEDDNDDDGTVCVICLDVLGDGESVVRLNCMHVFHRDCITQCLSRMAVPRCPLDRRPVTVPLDQLPVSRWARNSSPVSERLLAPNEEAQ